MTSTRRGRGTVFAAATAAGLVLAACGGSAAGPAVPSVRASGPGGGAQDPGGQGGGGTGATQAAALHAAAQCIRDHGIPSYADPVVGPGGHIFTDQRSLQDAPRTTIAAVQRACAALVIRAHFNPENEPPAPPLLVRAGVRSAECLRAHGLPGVTDPTSASPYTPGHGFGMTPSEVPAGGKASPAFQRAASACRQLLNAEVMASTLQSLTSGG